MKPNVCEIILDFFERQPRRSMQRLVRTCNGHRDGGSAHPKAVEVEHARAPPVGERKKVVPKSHHRRLPAVSRKKTGWLAHVCRPAVAAPWASRHHGRAWKGRANSFDARGAGVRGGEACKWVGGWGGGRKLVDAEACEERGGGGKMTPIWWRQRRERN